MADSENTRKPRSFKIDTNASRSGADAGNQTRGGARKKKARTGTASPVKAAATTRKPRSIRIDETPSSAEMQPDDAVDRDYASDLTPQILDELDEAASVPAAAKKRGVSWGKIFMGAFSVLVGIGISLWVEGLIRDLFSRNEMLGYGGLALVGIALIGLVGIVVRELIGLRRMRVVDGMRKRAAEAREANDLRGARRTVSSVAGLFESRPDTARGRSELAQMGDDVMDAGDLIGVAEATLLAPLDREARRMVLASAKRVSVVTAVSPRALIDVGFVLYENTRLIRSLAILYGGRPAFFSSIRLVRGVLLHLGATGAIAVGDGLMQQVIGQGLAARLSARLGEGVVNGLLTARIGISAMELCRPIAFSADKRPRLSEFVSDLTSLSAKSSGRPGS